MVFYKIKEFCIVNKMVCNFTIPKIKIEMQAKNLKLKIQ